SGWMVRPGAVLDVSDEIIFNAIVGNFLPQILEAISWSQGDPDVAYQIKAKADDPKWLSSGFFVWREFDQKSLDRLEEGTQAVAFADIAAFYENIDLPRLNSDLKDLGVENKLLDVLMRCLNRWSGQRGKGIPQGYSASDILAKVYLAPLDSGLRNAGFVHLRYVDDIRIFCQSSLEAKLSLLKLNDLLRLRGLNLQTAKTKILCTDEARSKITGVRATIQELHEQLREQLKEFSSGADSYA